MSSISVADLKSHLSEILTSLVATQETITITKHGKSIAVLSPIAPKKRVMGINPTLEFLEDFDSYASEEVDLWENNNADLNAHLN